MSTSILKIFSLVIIELLWYYYLRIKESGDTYMINKYYTTEECYLIKRNTSCSKLLTEKLSDKKLTFVSLGKQLDINPMNISLMQNGYNFLIDDFNKLCKHLNITEDTQSEILSNNITDQLMGAYIATCNNAYSQISLFVNAALYYECIYKCNNNYINNCTNLYMLLMNNLMYIPSWTSRQKRPEKYIQAEKDIELKIINFLTKHLGDINIEDSIFRRSFDIFDISSLLNVDKLTINNITPNIINNYIPSNTSSKDSTKIFRDCLNATGDTLANLAQMLDLSESHLEKIMNGYRSPSIETRTKAATHFKKYFGFNNEDLTVYISGEEQLAINKFIEELNSNIRRERKGILGNLLSCSVSLDEYISREANEFNRNHLFEANGKTLDITNLFAIIKVFNQTKLHSLLKDKDAAINLLNEFNKFNSELFKEYRNEINYLYKSPAYVHNNKYTYPENNYIELDTKLIKKLLNNHK